MRLFVYLLLLSLGLPAQVSASQVSPECDCKEKKKQKERDKKEESDKEEESDKKERTKSKKKLPPIDDWPTLRKGSES